MKKKIKFKRIERSSSIDQIVRDDRVEIIGITSTNQNEKGLIIYDDGSPSHVKMIAVRFSINNIKLQAYFPTPFGVKASERFEIYTSGSIDYVKYDKILKNIGI